MPVCDNCGTRFETDGYHVAANGRLYDSIECALRASSVRRRSDATAAWIAAARDRLGADRDVSTNVESEPTDH